MTRRSSVFFRAALAVLVVSAVAGGAPVHADVVARPAEPENGAALSEKLCAACHVVGTSDNRAGEAGIPTFASIANRPDQTAELVAGAIIVPHPPMPSVPLSLPEIRDIVSYIMTLRDEPERAN